MNSLEFYEMQLSQFDWNCDDMEYNHWRSVFDDLCDMQANYDLDGVLWNQYCPDEMRL